MPRQQRRVGQKPPPRRQPQPLPVKTPQQRVSRFRVGALQVAHRRGYLYHVIPGPDGEQTQLKGAVVQGIQGEAVANRI